VAFENSNRIRRFDPAMTRVLGEVRPPGMARWPINSGAEAMTRLADGRFVVISEDAPAPGGARAALIFSGDPTAPGPRSLVQLSTARIGLRRDRRAAIAGRAPVGPASPAGPRQRAVGDADGRRCRRHCRGRDGVGADHRAAAMAMAVDNMEALAITREGGRTILWIASDDNFLPIQQTLLLKFALEE
jgi:hypothetical protein